MSETEDTVELSDEEVMALGSTDLGFYTALSFPSFRIAPHHEAIIDTLNDVAAGKCDRVIITMPPRHGKSLLASQHFPAFYLGQHPDREIICATFNSDKARDWGVEVRNQLADPLYQQLFPGVALRQDSSAAFRFKTPQGGSYFAAGRNTAITGRGASLLVIDDLLKGDEEADSERIREKCKAWYTSVAYTRLAPNGAIVIIGTRWHEDDIIGYVLREHPFENWKVLNFAAIDEHGNALWPERFNLDWLLRRKRVLPNRQWSALYQQKPIDDEGSIIKRNWWQPWTTEVPVADFIVISVDTAYTEQEENDRSACTVWYVTTGADFRQKVLLRYCWAERLEFPELVTRIDETVRHFGQPGVPVRLVIEAKASGKSVAQELRRRLPNLSIWEVNPLGDKRARAYAVQPMFEFGSVYAIARMERIGAAGGDMPDQQEEAVFRPWGKACIDECASFPRGRHDDYVDSTTHGLRHIRNLGVELMPEDEPPPPPIPRQAPRDAALY